MVYKSSELLLLLPIGFRMEAHLGLLLWTLVEVVPCISQTSGIKVDGVFARQQKVWHGGPHGRAW